MVLRSHSSSLPRVFISIIFISLLCVVPALGQSPEAVELRVRGYHAQQRGSIQEAISFYTQAAEADPTYATPHNDLGILYEDQGDLNKAENEYRAAVRLDDAYAAAYTNLASLYDRQGRYAESLPLWRTRSAMGGAEDRWRGQAAERVSELEKMLDAEGRPAGSEPAYKPPASVGEVPDSEIEMAEEIAHFIAEEHAAQQDGVIPPPSGYTTVRLMPAAGEAFSADSSKAWYQRTQEAIEDRAHNEVAEAALIPEVKAKLLLAKAKAAIANDNYQQAVELLREARQLDPDAIEIDKLYWKAREKQIEDDIARASIDSAVYNRRKITEVEKKWFPPTPDAVAPFDRSKYIVKGSEKTAARTELERKARQIVPNIDFTDAKLKDVIEFLAVSNDINIVIDEEAVSPGERVTVHLKQIPLDEALEIILRTKGLKYRLEENIIWITSEERLLEEELEVRVYDVQDLVGKLYDFPSTPFDFEKFVETGSKSTTPSK